MFRIYVRKQNEKSGHVFKSHFSILNDKVAILPDLAFVLTGIISESEWAKSQELIKDKFNLYIEETQIDGRQRIAKAMSTFSWRAILEPSISKRTHFIYNNK